jgi:GNAT superfamily N-acetyltransferase
MAVIIKELTSKGDMKRLIRFPFSIYKGNKCWVPPLLLDEYDTLDPAKNPAFEYCEAKLWMAYKDGRPAGTIVGIINRRYIEKWGKKAARFGWFEIIDDLEVSKALLDTVESWAKAKGMESIVGPMGFCDLDKEGMLIEGFDELGTLPMIYNHPYYPKHMEAAGYRKECDWVEFFVKTPPEIPEKVKRVQELVMKRHKLKVAEVRSRKELASRYGQKLFELLNNAYAHLYGTVELTQAQISYYIKRYLGFVDLDFTKVIVDEHDSLAGFGIAMPSLSRGLQKAKGRILPFGFIHLLRALSKPEVIDMYLIAVRPDLQSKGVPAILMNIINENALKRGVIGAETSGELETNVEVQSLWKSYDARQHKRRRCYAKALI